MRQLSGTVALVSGGAEGTGAAVARPFVSDGAKLMLSDVRGDKAGGLASDLADAALGLPLSGSIRA